MINNQTKLIATRIHCSSVVNRSENGIDLLTQLSAGGDETFLQTLNCF